MKYEEDVNRILRKAENRTFAGIFVSANEKLVKAGLTKDEMYAILVDFNMHMKRNQGKISIGTVSAWLSNRINAIKLFSNMRDKNL